MTINELQTALEKAEEATGNVIFAQANNYIQGLGDFTYNCLNNVLKELK